MPMPGDFGGNGDADLAILRQPARDVL